MISKHCFAILLFFSLFSCSNPPEDSPDQVLPINEDVTEPVILIDGLADEMEVTTSINFSITDDSDLVTTTVRMDGQELITTEEKEFSIEIDPFDYINGERIITIEAIDGQNNQSSLSKSFELKKLLLVYSDIQFLQFLDSTNSEYFVSLNKINGDLIEYRKIDQLEENRFYAADGFERQNFVTSLFVISTDLATRRSGIISYADIPPGSVTLNASQVEAQSSSSDRSDSFELTMTGANETQNFYGLGKDYTLGIPANKTGNFQTEVLFDPAINNDILIFSNPDNLNNLNFYKYLFVKDFNDKVLSADDFIPIQEFKTIDFPLNIIDYSLSFSGYENEEEFKNNKYSILLRKNGERNSSYIGKVDVPIMDNFEVYSKSFSAGITDKIRFFSITKGFSEVTIPNWNATVNADVVETSGDYDIVQLSSTFRGTPINGTRNFLSWTYRRKNNQQFDMPFEAFQIPEEIKNMIEIAQIDPNDPSQLLMLSVSLQDFEMDVNIEKGVFTGYGQNQYGDEESMVFIIKDGVGI